MCANETGNHHATEFDLIPSTESNANHPRVLLAEDDDEMRRMLASAFRTSGYRVTECTDGLALFNTMWTSLLRTDSTQFDVIVSDIRMPGLTGLDILRGVHEREGAPPVVLITAFGDQVAHEEAERLGAAAVLNKPFRIERLLDTVRKILANASIS
jgi:CheY-like chemotaxis protein